MINFKFINSNDGYIRIFYFYQNNKKSISDEINCNLDEIIILSNILLDTLSELNQNLHSRIQLFEQLKNTSLKLYQKCIEPAINILKPDKKHLRIQFEFDQELGIIPFEFFYNGSFFLSEKYLINRKIKRKKDSIANNEKNKNICISGNFNNELKIKKSVLNELDEISNLFNMHSLNYSGPNLGPIENKFEINNLISNSKIFHYSGHYNNTEDNMGWKMKNATYKISDFSKLARVPNFLFCNTCGISINLNQSKFFFELYKLGINNIIFTTGEINTEFSRKFSILFYKEFLNGKDISASLLNTKKMFIKKYGYSNPCWLQYNLLGDGQFILNNKTISKNIKPLNGISISIILITILSFTFIKFNRWYKESYNNKLIHIISKNVEKGLEIYNKDGNFINPDKPIRIYNNDIYTFYADGFDSLNSEFILLNSKLNVLTKGTSQYIFDNNLYNTFIHKDDTIFINLIYNGLCNIELKNQPKNTNIYFGFYSTIYKKRNWKKVHQINNKIKIHPYFQNDLFLKIEQNNSKKYFKYNNKGSICEMELNLSTILNKNSKDWIYIGF